MASCWLTHLLYLTGSSFMELQGAVKQLSITNFYSSHLKARGLCRELMVALLSRQTGVAETDFSHGDSPI